MAVEKFVAYREAVEAENRQRIKDHQQQVEDTADSNPLNLLADGDSWFDYPLDGDLPLIHTDVIAQLRRQLANTLILSLAHAGDATTDIMGVTKFRTLHDLLMDPAHGRFHAILFSAGGNDLVGEQFRFWLHDAVAVGGDPARAINSPALNDIMGVVETAYRDLAALRTMACGPTVPIFTHAYDFASPTGEGVCTLGPWLLPSLQSRGWMKSAADPKDLAIGQQIVRQILLRFDNMLQLLEGDPYLNIVYVRTQGTLPPGTSSWANELHPTPTGFAAIAARFAEALKQRFPAHFRDVPPPAAAAFPASPNG